MSGWQFSAPVDSPRIAVPEQGVTNYYDPTLTGIVERTLVNSNGAILANWPGSVVSISVSVTAGQPFSFSVSAASNDWQLYDQANFYQTATASVAPNFLSRKTSLSPTNPIVFSGDGRSISCASSPHTGFVHFSFKYTPNGNYNAANAIPAGSVAALLPFVMFNRGPQPALLSDFGATGTVDQINTPPVLPAGFMIIAKHGEKFYHRYPNVKSSGEDLVERHTSAGFSRSYNNTWQPSSIVQMAGTTGLSAIPGAFSEGYSATSPFNPKTWDLGTDNIPARMIHFIFLGGNHGLISWIITMTAHGKTNANCVGSLWGKLGKLWMCTQIIDANRLVMTFNITGNTSNWVTDGSSPGTGAFVHVSGASATATITGTAVAQTQLYPSVQRPTLSLTTDGGKKIVANGAYLAERSRVLLSYGIPSGRGVLDYIASQIGNSAELTYGVDAIPTQCEIQVDEVRDAYGATTLWLHSQVLLGHNLARQHSGQFQVLTHSPAPAAANETIWAYAFGTKSFQAGPTQTGGLAKDFSTPQNITSNTGDYYFNAASWEAGSFYEDGIQRVATAFKQEVRDSAGTVIKARCMINDTDEGRCSEGIFSPIGLNLSAVEKMYLYSDGGRNVVAGQSDCAISATWIMDLTADPVAQMYGYWPKSGCEYGFIWNASVAVTAHSIPIRADQAGNHMEFYDKTSSITSISYTDTHILITTTGKAGFRARVRSDAL